MTAGFLYMHLLVYWLKLWKSEILGCLLYLGQMRVDPFCESTFLYNLLLI
jgi:hypothetical protein